jgi:hypothetical protein
MIEGLGTDYPLNLCDCGHKKSPEFWFRRDESWTVKCSSVYCEKHFDNRFVKPKKLAVERWNDENIPE